MVARPVELGGGRPIVAGARGGRGWYRQVPARGRGGPDRTDTHGARPAIGCNAIERSPLALWTGITRGAQLDRLTAVGLDRRWEILEGVAATLIAAAPAVVVLEDVHSADESSIWLLERMVGALAEAPVLLLVTARRHEPGTADLSSVRRGADVLELTGLDLASTIALVEARSGRDASEAEDLWTLSGGNPLFLRELLVFPAGHDRTPPHAVSELLDRVLAGLPAESLDVLAALAVTGGSTQLSVRGASRRASQR